MAELQLKVRYRTPQTAVGFAAVAGATPIWALGAPALCGLVIGYALSNPAGRSSAHRHAHVLGSFVADSDRHYAGGAV